MRRVVVDTNVLISGFLWQGTPKKCLDAFRYENAYILILSTELVDEFLSKLLHKFKVEPTIARRWVSELSIYGEKVFPMYTTEICRDPRDNKILDTAQQGKADFIVTGDKDLLILKNFHDTEIIPPKSFWKILGK